MSEFRDQMTASGLRLGAISLVAVGVLALVYAGTRDSIREQERRAQLRVLEAVLPQSEYDNDLLTDMIQVTDEGLLGNTEPKRLFRGRLEGQPSVIALQTTAPKGYNGDIELIVGIRHDGTLTGVRVVRHNETPGLGDGIDVEVSDWILQFTGRSLIDPAINGWAVRRDGGEFDQFTGATITPRAVVEAVRKALQFHEQNRDWLYEQAASNNESD